MIKLRLNALTSNEQEIEFVAGENLSQLIKRLLTDSGLDSEDENVLQHFCALLDGHEIPREFWEYCAVEEGVNILISPVIRGGDFGSIFKQVAVLLAVVALTVYTGGVGVGSFSATSPFLFAGAAAAVSIGGTLLLNAIIPPPTPGGFGGFGSGGNDYTESQMHSIAGQANSAGKYGNVPKVYGTHRMFPLVAAVPYTDLETDPSTGNLVQYFYGLYDFGYGPLIVSDIKIGDTPVGSFSDVEYKFVDFNKPEISEGFWDDSLDNKLVFYKGDVEVDAVSTGINENRVDGGALEDYQIVRNAATNGSGYNQEISLNFVCPQGLFGFAANGDRSDRTIELEIDFSKADEDIWIPYNDLNYVSDYRASGGIDTVFPDVALTVAPDLLGPVYSVLSQVSQGSGILSHTTFVDHIKVYYAAGTNQVIVKTSEVLPGDILSREGGVLGVILSLTAITSKSGFSVATLDRVLTRDYTLAYLVTTQPYNRGTGMPSGAITYGGDIVPSITYRKIVSSGRARITGRSQTQIFATFRFKPKEIASYKIRVTRVITYSTATYQVADTLTLYEVATRFDADPVITTKRHVFLEIKIRATDQINGAIQNISARATSVLDVYDPDTETWNKQPTSNPAWIFADLLTGEVNKRAISKDRLDTTSLVEWAEFCDQVPTSTPSIAYTQERFQCNFILDFNTTLQGILGAVSNAAQASLNLIDGKYGVLIDKLKTVPVQIFTPRNSSGFSSTRNYAVTPDALRVKFIDPSINWQQSETIVYNDGFDELTAVEFDDLESFGVTNYEQAWRFGRYMMAQNKLRQEQISLTVDFEYLVCTRGDYVQITQDVMLAGGQPARVRTVVGSTITIDDGISTDLGLDYGYVYRGVGGIGTDTLNVINSNTFELLGDLPEVGDLIVIGEVGHITIDCLVKSISPTDELTAQILLVEKADGVYESESSMTLPEYIPNLSIGAIDGNTPPGEVQSLEVLENSWYFTGSGYQNYVDLDWNVPLTGGTYEAFEIYVNSGTGYDLYTVTRNSDGRVLIDVAKLGIEHMFKVLAVSATGAKLDLASVGFVAATPLRKTARPSNVADLYINVTNEVIQLNWTAVTDVDVKQYLIRYSPQVDGSWNSSVPLLRTGNVNTLVSTQARTGTYFIKAIDYNGNESDDVASAITSIPNLFNLNIIEETSDFPDLFGVTELTSILSDSVVLQNKVVGGITTNEFYPVGYYYYNEFLDLGDIYSVRLQSLIQAEGLTIDDLMGNWVTLSSVLAMSNATFSDWDVETQVRATNSFNVMSEWDSLDIIDPLSEGDQDNFTAWRSFVMGDFTGRIFQFRLKLISNKASVSPRVSDAIIKADMPDRADIYNNLTSSATDPYVVTYSTPFKGPGTSPNVQITQDNAESGDRVVISNKTLSEFEIVFYDITDTQVVRQFDVAAKGYGRKSSNTI